MEVGWGGPSSGSLGPQGKTVASNLLIKQGQLGRVVWEDSVSSWLLPACSCVTGTGALAGRRGGCEQCSLPSLPLLLPFCPGTSCLSVLRLQRPGLSARSTGFEVRTSGTASCYGITQGCCESGGKAGPWYAVQQCHCVRQHSGLLPCTMTIMSVQKGCGDRASQPPHLACPWRG